MTASTCIESLGVYLPPAEVSTARILSECKRKIRVPFETLTGVRSRRMAGETEFAIDLAEKAILDCLQYSRYRPGEIDVLISANISRYDGPGFHFVFEPATSVRLKARLGFSNAIAFDITNACAGMFTAVSIVDAMIRGGMIRRGLVVSGEYITHLTRTAQKEIEGNFDQRLACLTLGDAGAAVIIEEAPPGGAGFRALEMHTLGEFSSYCIARPTDQPHGGAIMHTDMINLSTVSFKYGNGHAAGLLRRVGWSPSDLRHILVHQTSRLSIEGAARELRRRLGRDVFQRLNMVNNLADRGNTASTSHFVALADSIRAGSIQEGEKIVFGILASGLTVGTGLYTFDGLPGRLRSPAPAVEPPPPLSAVTESYFPGTGTPRVKIEAMGAYSPPETERPDSLELISRAAGNCLGDSRSIQDVDLLIHCGVYRTDFICEPALAAMAAGKLGLGKASSDGQAFVFDVMNGALGFLNGCLCAIAMLRARQHRSVLVVASEVENNAGVPAAGLRGLRPAASAVLLETGNDGQGFGGFLFRDDPRHGNVFEAYISQKDGMTTMSFKKEAEMEPVYLDGLVEAFHGLLRREGIAVERVTAVLPPQISKSFVAALRQRLPVRPDVVVDASCGDRDLFTSSLACTLEELYRTKRPAPGDVGIILSLGSGMQTAAAVYHF